MSGTHGFCWCYFSFSQAMFHCWGTCVASCQDLHVCPLYPSYLFKSSRAILYFFNHVPCWAYLFGTRHLWAVQLLASWAIILFKNRRLASTSKFCLNGLSYPDHTIHLLYEMFLISVFIVWCIGCQSVCVRRPGFIMCTGGTTYGQLPTYSNTSAAPR